MASGNGAGDDHYGAGLGVPAMPGDFLAYGGEGGSDTA